MELESWARRIESSSCKTAVALQNLVYSFDWRNDLECSACNSFLALMDSALEKGKPKCHPCHLLHTPSSHLEQQDLGLAWWCYLRVASRSEQW